MPIKEPDFGTIASRPGRKAASQYLRGQLGGGGLDAEQMARARSFDVIAAQEEAALRDGLQGLSGAIGFNNRTPAAQAIAANARLASPHQASDLLAREAGQNDMLNLISGFNAHKQGTADYYSTLAAPWLQEQQMKMAAALAAAGESSGLGSMLGAGAGAGLGFLVGGPLGAGIGASMGGSIGGSL